LELSKFTAFFVEIELETIKERIEVAIEKKYEKLYGKQKDRFFRKLLKTSQSLMVGIFQVETR
jgi:hypothetical protein